MSIYINSISFLIHSFINAIGSRDSGSHHGWQGGMSGQAKKRIPKFWSRKPLLRRPRYHAETTDTSKLSPYSATSTTALRTINKSSRSQHLPRWQVLWSSLFELGHISAGGILGDHLAESEREKWCWHTSEFQSEAIDRTRRSKTTTASECLYKEKWHVSNPNGTHSMKTGVIMRMAKHV